MKKLFLVKMLGEIDIKSSFKSICLSGLVVLAFSMKMVDGASPKRVS